MAQINARYVFQRCCDNREPAITQFQLQFDNVQFGVRVCVCVCVVLMLVPVGFAIGNSSQTNNEKTRRFLVADRAFVSAHRPVGFALFCLE